MMSCVSIVTVGPMSTEHRAVSDDVMCQSTDWWSIC